MQEWWRGGVIYQIYPRSFQDSNGDGIGDLPGITARLGHVADLGVDAIWLSPFFTSPMADMGYDVSDYCDVDPIFGTIADFRALTDRAHELGLKVIIDQVLSHTSDRHPWFQASRRSRRGDKADWYVWARARPDGSVPNNWQSVFGGPAWEWNPARGQYFLHNFLAGQPDLNFHNPEVQDALLDVLRFWLELGVDGFRFDTVNYYFHDQDLRDNPPLRHPHSGEDLASSLDPVNGRYESPYGLQEHLYDKTQPENLDFLKRIRALMDLYPGTTTVGEVGDADRSLATMAAYTEGSERLHMCYSFDMLGPQFTAGHFRSKISQFFATAPDGWPCWTFSNHDVNRHVTRWLPHAIGRDALAEQAAALLLSMRGSICLYQGEELGLEEAVLDFAELTDPPGIRFWPDEKGRDGCRTPMPWSAGGPPSGFTTGTPWLPVKPPQAARAVETLDADPDSVLNYYRQMLHLRRDSGALSKGDMMFVRVEEPILAFVRDDGTERLFCVFNLSEDELTLELEPGLVLDETLPVSRRAALADGRLVLEGNAVFIAPLAEASELPAAMV